MSAMEELAEWLKEEHKSNYLVTDSFIQWSENLTAVCNRLLEWVIPLHESVPWYQFRMTRLNRPWGAWIDIPAPYQHMTQELSTDFELKIPTLMISARDSVLEIKPNDGSPRGVLAPDGRIAIVCDRPDGPSVGLFYLGTRSFGREQSTEGPPELELIDGICTPLPVRTGPKNLALLSQDEFAEVIREIYNHPKIGGSGIVKPSAVK